MNFKFLVALALSAMALAFIGCNGSDSGSGATTGITSPTPTPGPSPTPAPIPAPKPFQLVGESMPANATNVALSNFTLTYTFSNDVSPASAQQDLNASAIDTNVKLTSASGNEPIAIAVSGTDMTITLKDAGASLLPSTKYTLVISTSLLDVNSQTLQSSPALVLNFTTVAGTYPGYVTFAITHDNPYTNLSVTSFTVSFGDKSELLNPTDVVPPSDAQYDLVNDQTISGLTTTPVIPAGVYPATTFQYRYFYALTSKTTYYFAIKACANGANGEPSCSTFSPQLPYLTP